MDFISVNAIIKCEFLFSFGPFVFIIHCLVVSLFHIVAHSIFLTPSSGRSQNGIGAGVLVAEGVPFVIDNSLTGAT